MKTKIVYEDSEILVVYKPAGIATEASGSFSMDVISELKNYLKIPNPYVAMIHRLDQPVEGLLVFAKTKAAASELSKQLTSGELKKNYIAVVAYDESQLEKEPVLGENFHLKDEMYKDAKNNMAVITNDEHLDCKNSNAPISDIKNLDKKNQNASNPNYKNSDIKKAILDFQFLNICKEAGIALVSVQIATGRFHQIRCQMWHFGLPLLGDQKYKNDLSESISLDKNIRHVALCANEISFIHPKTKKPMHFTVEPVNKAFKL